MPYSTGHVARKFRKTFKLKGHINVKIKISALIGKEHPHG